MLAGGLVHADPEERLAPVGMSRVEIGREALYLLPEVVSELAGGARVALVVDATPMRRDGGDLKSGVERLLGGRFEVRRATIGGGALHADEAVLEGTAAAVSGAALWSLARAPSPTSPKGPRRERGARRRWSRGGRSRTAA